ncbi:MAG: LamG domain-containing protein [Planctomycetota bacterium]
MQTACKCSAVVLLTVLLGTGLVLADDLLLDLPLTEGKGDVAKSTVGGFQGKFTGAVPQGSDGWFAGVRHFNGVDSMLGLPATSALKLPKDFTISAWVFPQRYAAPKEDKVCILTKRSSFYFQLRPDGRLNGGFYYRTRATGKGYDYVELAGAEPVGLLHWSFLVFTYDGSRMRLYVNGKPAGECPLDSPGVLENDASISIGYEADFGRPFAGLLAQLRIHARALGEDEIRALMDPWTPPAVDPQALPPVGESAVTMPVRRYLDDTPLPSPTPEENQRGYIAFSRPYVDLVFEEAVPLASERARELALRLAPGEYEPATFALRALRPLSSVRVSVEGGNLPSDWLDLRVARSMLKRFHAKFSAYGRTGDTGTQGQFELMRVPTWLASTETVDLPENTSSWWWITVHAPQDARPGDYTATINLEAQGQPKTPLLALRVRVLPFELEPPTGYSIGFYDSPATGNDWSPAERFADQRAHGMTSVGWTGSAQFALARSRDDVTVDFSGCALDKVMDAYRDAAFPEPILWLMAQDLQQWCLTEAQGDADKAGAYYRTVIRAIEERRKKRAWPEIIYQPGDEVIHKPKAMEDARSAIRWLKAEGVRTEMDHFCTGYGGPTDDYVRDVLQYTDVVTNRFTTRPIWYRIPWPEIVKWTRDGGKVLWTYNITDAKTFPSPTTLRFTHGWFFRSFGLGCRGIFMWMYSSTFGDPYNEQDPMGQNGLKFDDMYYRLPPDPSRNYSGGPTIEYECMREGVDDLRYCLTLDRAIKDARAGGDTRAKDAARRAETLLAELLGKFDFAKLAAKSSWVESHFDDLVTLPDGTLAAKGKFLIPNGFQISDYDDARNRIIDAILEIRPGD